MYRVCFSPSKNVFISERVLVCSGVWFGEKFKDFLDLLLGDVNGEYIFLQILFTVLGILKVLFGAFCLEVGGFFGGVIWAAASCCSPSMRFLASIRRVVGSGKPLGRIGGDNSIAPSMTSFYEGVSLVSR